MVNRLASTIVLIFGVVASMALFGAWKGGHPWPDSIDSLGQWWLPAAWDGALWVWSNTEQANWILLFAGAVLLVAPVLLGMVSRTSRRDPIRLFTHDDRMVGFKRVGGRCEMDNFLLMRCHRKAEHGDHWYPWSKGGKTSMQNFVAGCAKHNMAKSNAWPTWGQTARVATRRHIYMQHGFTSRPGERI